MRETSKKQDLLLVFILLFISVQFLKVVKENHHVKSAIIIGIPKTRRISRVPWST